MKSICKSRFYFNVPNMLTNSKLQYVTSSSDCQSSKNRVAIARAVSQKGFVAGLYRRVFVALRLYLL